MTDAQLEVEKNATAERLKDRHQRRRLDFVVKALAEHLLGKSDEKVRGLIDPNHDGVVEKEELWGVLKNMTFADGRPMTIKDAVAIATELDGDDDGVLSTAAVPSSPRSRAARRQGRSTDHPRHVQFSAFKRRARAIVSTGRRAWTT